jgi:hypothetical protein
VRLPQCTPLVRLCAGDGRRRGGDLSLLNKARACRVSRYSRFEGRHNVDAAAFKPWFGLQMGADYLNLGT